MDGDATIVASSDSKMASSDSKAAAAAELRRRKAPDSKPGSPASSSAAVRTARLDTRSGHVGITCSNSDDPLGVRIIDTDTADLAHKGGRHGKGTGNAL